LQHCFFLFVHFFSHFRHFEDVRFARCGRTKQLFYFVFAFAVKQISQIDYEFELCIRIVALFHSVLFANAIRFAVQKFAQIDQNFSDFQFVGFCAAFFEGFIVNVEENGSVEVGFRSFVVFDGYFFPQILRVEDGDVLFHFCDFPNFPFFVLFVKCNVHSLMEM
jgi:hypothetical protein